MTGETLDLSQCGNQGLDKEAESEKDKKVVLRTELYKFNLTESVNNWRHGRRLAANTGINIDSLAMVVGVLHFC